MKHARVVVFASLVIATFGAFFVAQRLKNAPTVISNLRIGTGGVGTVFSPNGDGRRDEMRVGFKVTDADRVTVTMINAEGDPVRTLVDDKPVGSYTRLSGIVWDGRDNYGKLVPDGRYRVRISLRNQGRAYTSPRSVLKDTAPPQPIVASIGPERDFGPEILPGRRGDPARVRFRDPALDCPQVRVFRTAPGPIVEVLRDTMKRGQQRWSWNGRLPLRRPRGGQHVCDRQDQGPLGRTEPAAAGTYVVVPEWRDRAGNIGTPMKVDSKGRPIPTAASWPGRGGITVRRIGAQAPVVPAITGRRVVFGVDSRGLPYRWSMKLLGSDSRSKRSKESKTKVLVKARAPGERSGIYLFTAGNRRASTTVPFAVQGKKSVAGTPQAPRGVLVMLPTITWSGSNPLDDDGDGAPNLLARGTSARLARVSANGLPFGFVSHEAPTMIWLDRRRHRYDLTTDAALAQGAAPRLSSYRGVLIPGDARWLPANVRESLRKYVRDGGTVVSLGTNSLRRTVKLDKRGRLVDPSKDRVADLFGARIRAIVRDPTRLQLFKDDPTVVLFKGSDGSFKTVDAYEQTIGLGNGKLLSSAVTIEPANRTVIVAARYGKGNVIRTGLPDFAVDVARETDPALNALMERLWVLLSR
jgi:hypothetical protein